MRLIHISALTLLLHLTAAAANLLSFPREVTFQLQSAAPTNFVFSVTNLTAQPKQISAYYASCGCSSVDMKDRNVAPYGTQSIRIGVRTAISKKVSLIFSDEATNLYQTIVVLKMSTNQMPKALTPQRLQPATGIQTKSAQTK